MLAELSRFNEAGAINPGKPCRSLKPKGETKCFNEAGAINPGKPPEITCESTAESVLQ